MHIPKTAYVLLWFPLSSETFIFQEVVQLEALGLPVRVYTTYGRALRGCSATMRDYAGKVTRLGCRALWPMLLAFGRACRRQPAAVWQLVREGMFRRMCSWEMRAENLCCFLAGFRLAELLREDAMDLIHSPWGNGPATAAWVASRMTGLPFILTGRAGDIYPEDGILQQKLRDATLVRTNNAHNVRYLESMCPAGQDKVRLVYNCLTFRKPSPSAVAMQSPYRLLAVGRMARTKGFDVLLTALARLRREGFAFRMTLVGDGWWRRRLLRLLRRLRLQECVATPGFVPHDKLQEYMASHDMLIVPSVVDKSGDRDGIPNVIMEALSKRLPVLATDVSGISEVVRHELTGILVPQRDPKALALGIRRLTEDRATALRMAEAGRALVASMFDARTNIRTLYDLYLEAYTRGTKALA